jgi:hypothetical protein
MCKAVKFPRKSVTGPDSLLLLKSNIAKHEVGIALQVFHQKTDWNLNSEVLEPVDHLSIFGMFPDKLFSARSINSSLLHDCNEVGNIPDRLFQLRCSVRRELREPMLDGISPQKLLREKSMIYRFELLCQQFGSSPERLLLDRSITSIVSILHRFVGITPLRKLCESSR